MSSWDSPSNHWRSHGRKLYTPLLQGMSHSTPYPKVIWDYPYVNGFQVCTLDKGICSEDIQVTIPYYSNYSPDGDIYLPIKPFSKTFQIRKNKERGQVPSSQKRKEPQIYWSSFHPGSIDCHSLSHFAPINAPSTFHALIHFFHLHSPLETSSISLHERLI